MTAICVLCAFAGLISIGFTVLLAAGRIPLSAGAFLIQGGLEQLGPVAFVLYAVLMILMALALWKRWRWARRVAILVAVIGIALAVPALSSAVMDLRTFAIVREGLQIVTRVVVVYYLSQEPAKEWFVRP